MLLALMPNQPYSTHIRKYLFMAKMALQVSPTMNVKIVVLDHGRCLKQESAV